MPYKRQKYKKLALISQIQAYQILTDDDEVCFPSLSSIFLAVPSQLKLIYVSMKTDCFFTKHQILLCST